jgi:hypothetical protein
VKKGKSRTTMLTLLSVSGKQSTEKVLNVDIMRRTGPGKVYALRSKPY